MDGPGKECELRVDGSGQKKHIILLLVICCGVTTDRDLVTFYINQYETIGCFVEYYEAICCSSKSEGLVLLVQHLCYCQCVVVYFEG